MEGILRLLMPIAALVAIVLALKLTISHLTQRGVRKENREMLAYMRSRHFHEPETHW